MSGKARNDHKRRMRAAQARQRHSDRVRDLVAQAEAKCREIGERMGFVSVGFFFADADDTTIGVLGHMADGRFLVVVGPASGDPEASIDAKDWDWQEITEAQFEARFPHGPVLAPLVAIEDASGSAAG